MKTVFSRMTAVLVLLASSTLLQAADDAPTSRLPMTAVDLVELPRLGSPALSPDGTRVIYSRSEVDWEKNKNNRQYRLVDLASGDTIELVPEEGGPKSVNPAVWAGGNDGFVTTHKGEEDEYRQAYYFDIDARTLEPLTVHGANVQRIIWAPDDSGFYFSAKSQRSAEDAADFKNDWVIKEYETERFDEVWFYDWNTGRTQELFGGDFDTRALSLSRDGRFLLFNRVAHAQIDRPFSEVWRYEISSKKLQRITENEYAESDPVLSPDNRRIAYIATVNHKGENYYEDNIFIQTIGESDAELILPKLAMEMVAVDWDKAGSGLYLLGNTGLRTHLYHYDIASRVLKPLTEGNGVIDRWRYDAELGTHLFSRQTSIDAGDLWLLTMADARPRRVSSEYADLVERFALPLQTPFTWRGRGRVTLEGLLAYPIGHVEGEPFPLVTITHGGPRSSSQFGSWNVSRYVAVLAGEGYGVFLPNHRGGTGYGDAFLRDMVGAYFRNAHHDVLDGIDALVDQGLADPDRLIKMGWSAGGHMTNKIITFTNRFQAASSGAGYADFASFYAESDVRYNRTPWLGGAPWEKNAPLAAYQRQSILKDLWRVKTPTLFFVGEKDVRVPPTQSILMYRGAKAAGADVRLYVAPGQSHGFAKPSYRLFKINRELQWYAQHLGRPVYQPVYPDQRAESRQ